MAAPCEGLNTSGADTVRQDQVFDLSQVCLGAIAARVSGLVGLDLCLTTYGRIAKSPYGKPARKSRLGP
jgi:hypothetical protein